MDFNEIVERVPSLETRTARRSCRTRKRALHVYLPGVAARGTCGQCVMARCCCCARCYCSAAATAIRQFTDSELIITNN